MTTRPLFDLFSGRSGIFLMYMFHVQSSKELPLCLCWLSLSFLCPPFVPVYPAQIPFLLLLVMFDAQATICSLRCILWIPPFFSPFYTPVFYMVFFQWSLRRYQLRLQFNALRLGDNIQHQCLRFQFVYNILY